MSITPTATPRAEEFHDVVKGLWDSWDDDAIIRDRATGRYTDPTKVHILGHQGAHFSVRGPLNVARSPQGHPIVAQAGSSEPGRALAARTADVVFTAQVDINEARAFYNDVKGRMAAHGRAPHELKIMPGIRFVLGATEREAQDRYALMTEDVSDAAALMTIQRLTGGVDLRLFPLYGPLPSLKPSNAAKARQKMMVDLAQRENLSIRQLDRRFTFSLGHLVYVGTAMGLADLMEEWFRAGAADGFTMLSPYYPTPLEEFVADVVPVLQHRGLFRTQYEGTTLRDHLGLARPANRLARPCAPAGD